VGSFSTSTGYWCMVRSSQHIASRLSNQSRLDWLDGFGEQQSFAPHRPREDGPIAPTLQRLKYPILLLPCMEANIS
jgi:hypothetical protein